ncbi:MAG: PIN domain-containing protein [Thermoanaerobaculia bacterium]
MVIADTGFWIALANRRDKFHGRAKAWLDAIDEPLVTTWPVMAETCHLLLHRLGPESQWKYVDSCSRGAFDLFQLERSTTPRVAALMQKYADLPMDLADASLVLLAEHLGHGRILSTDQRDFMAYRWKQHEPFHNLLMEDP